VINEMPYKKPPNEAQVRQHENEAWALRCRGWSLRRIAEHMGLSPEGIRQILQRIDRRELAALSKNYEHLKIIQYHRLEHVIEQCSESWDKSKEPRKRASQKTTDADADAAGATVTSTDVVEQCGDPAYLYCLMAAMDKERSLFGLDISPAPNNVAWTVADVALDMKRRGDERKARLAHEAAWGRKDADAAGLAPLEKDSDEATKAAGDEAA
jgi:hypothetical protein